MTDGICTNVVDEPEEPEEPPTGPVVTDTFYEWCPQGDVAYAGCIFCHSYLYDDNSMTTDCATCAEGLENVHG